MSKTTILSRFNSNPSKTSQQMAKDLQKQAMHAAKGVRKQAQSSYKQVQRRFLNQDTISSGIVLAALGLLQAWLQNDTKRSNKHLKELNKQANTAWGKAQVALQEN